MSCGGGRLDYYSLLFWISPRTDFLLSFKTVNYRSIYISYPHHVYKCVIGSFAKEPVLNIKLPLLIMLSASFTPILLFACLTLLSGANGHLIQAEYSLDERATQCGPGVGSCPSGSCCNKSGQCGTDHTFCSGMYSSASRNHQATY
jgi:hypothetical protein